MSQKVDITTKNIKMNANVLANSICLHCNYCIVIGEFPQVFKHADITSVSHTCQDTTKRF